MRSFSSISLIATLAFAAFTSAAPTVAAPAVDISARYTAIEARCSGCTVLTGLLYDLGPHCDALSGTKGITSETAPGIADRLKAMTKAVTDTHKQLVDNPTLLKGLSRSDCVGLLAALLNLVCGVVALLLGLLGGLSSSDYSYGLIRGLLCELLTVVANLVTLVLCIVGGLLATLLAGIIPTVVALVAALLGLLSPSCYSAYNGLGLLSVLIPGLLSGSTKDITGGCLNKLLGGILSALLGKCGLLVELLKALGL